MADRPKKLLFACGLLVVGVGGAMMFRQSPIQRQIPEAQFGGLVLQAIDPSVSLPIPPLPPDPPPTDSPPPVPSQPEGTAINTPLGEPVPAAPAPQRPEPAPTPHLLGSIELAETPPQPKSVTPVTTRAARPVFELPEPASAVAPAVAGVSPPSTGLPTAPAKVLPVSRLPSMSGSAEAAHLHWRMHRVREGETLSSLARRYLGAADRYRELYAANRDVLNSPDQLPLGVTLRVPTSTSDVEADSGLLPPAPMKPIPPGAWRRSEH